MITVKKLKQLLEQIPEDAEVNVYEGEDVGINVFDSVGNKNWWIRVYSHEDEDTFTEGFEKTK